MITAAVVDIEGTTSAIAYVRDQLFPYARTRISDWISRNRDRPETRAVLDETRALIERPDASTDEVINALLRWADEDSKTPPLKTLQGWIWQEGFAAGELRGHVYADVPAALREWTSGGISVYVYSSGSSAAQRAWFRNSQAGDLLPYVSGHFDLNNAGPKRDSRSYDRIAERLGVPSRRIVFFSDVGAELDAARDAGWHTVLVRRPDEETTDTETAHLTVPSLAEITLTGAQGDRPRVRGPQPTGRRPCAP